MDERPLWMLAGATLCLLPLWMRERAAARRELQTASLIDACSHLVKTAMEAMTIKGQMEEHSRAVGDIAKVLQGLHISVSNLVMATQRDAPPPPSRLNQHGMAPGPVVPPIPTTPTPARNIDPSPPQPSHPKPPQPSGTPM